jgi:type II secretion system protein G
MVFSFAPRRAFTLIELLIVVAIIAILAAIAVPNFLEAQTRAKVSSARSSKRQLFLALNAYAVDNNRFPSQNQLVDPLLQRQALLAISTPIAYVTSLPSDPFSRVELGEPGILRVPYYVNLNQIDAIPPAARELNQFVLGSVGPDGIQDTAEALFDLWGNGWNQIEATGIYDPTNGTISAGDIVRTHCSERGGASNRGGI